MAREYTHSTGLHTTIDAIWVSCLGLLWRFRSFPGRDSTDNNSVPSALAQGPLGVVHESGETQDSLLLNDQGMGLVRGSFLSPDHGYVSKS